MNILFGLKTLSLTFLLIAGLTFGYNFVSTSHLPQKSTVLLVRDQSNGSGVLIGRRLVLTVDHVARMGVSVKVGDRLIPTHVVSEDRILDIALLQTDEDVPGEIAAIGPNVTVGESVVAVGFPAFYEIKTQISTEGRVQSDDSITLTSTASIAPGNSGGGLFSRSWNGKFKLVGLSDRIPVIPMGFFSQMVIDYIGMSVSTPVIRQFVKFGEIVHFDPSR